MSSRELAERTGLERRNVIRAIDGLTERDLVTIRQGTPTQAAGYLVHSLAIVPMGGVATTPPP